MRTVEQTLEEGLIEAGYWGKEDGAFNADGPSVGIVLVRIQRRLASGVSLDFHVPAIGQPRREAWLVRNNDRHFLATGQTISDAICNAAMALPDFLKNHPECEN